MLIINVTIILYSVCNFFVIKLFVCQIKVNRNEFFCSYYFPCLKNFNCNVIFFNTHIYTRVFSYLRHSVHCFVALLRESIIQNFCLRK